MKIKTKMFFWRLNNEFANKLQNVVFQWAFIRGWYFAEKCLKNGFRVQIEGWAFIRAWAFIRDITVFQGTNTSFVRGIDSLPKAAIRKTSKCSV